MRYPSSRRPGVATTIVFAVWTLTCVPLVVRGQQPSANYRPAGPYLGQAPPGRSPRVFAPGIVSTEAHEFSCSFAPDATEFYFTSDRPLPGGEHSPMNVWFVRRAGEGWSEPTPAGSPFNPGNAMYVSMALDGTIYTTDMSRGPGSEHIVAARLVDGQYRELERLGQPVNSGSRDMYPFIAPDGRYLVFVSERDSRNNGGGLFVSFRQPGGAWGEPEAIDIGMPAGLPVVSPDGKHLFFTAGDRGKSDIYWVDASFLRRP